MRSSHATIITIRPANPAQPSPPRNGPVSHAGTCVPAAVSAATSAPPASSYARAGVEKYAVEGETAVSIIDHASEPMMIAVTATATRRVNGTYLARRRTTTTIASTSSGQIR